ncbi:MAG: leucine-rich repeat domain-containing protein [Coprobacillus sp.]|nr:leucine-rich repeat domain-containing protein [Coprobacillus sp.]
MARKKNMINGIKVIRRYNAATIWTGIFCLVLVALFVLPFFFDIFQIGEYLDAEHTLTEIAPNTGWDFSKFLFGMDASPFEVFKERAVWNVELISLGTLLTWVEYVMVAFLLLGAIYAFVGLLYALGLLLLGHVRKYSGPRSLAILAFILILVNFALMWTYTYLMGMGFDEENVGQYTQYGYFFAVGVWPYIYLGGTLIVMIVLCSIYGCAFKDRVYVGDLPWSKEYIKSELTNTTPLPAEPEAPALPNGMANQFPYIIVPNMYGAQGPQAQPQPQIITIPMMVTPNSAPAQTSAPAPTPVYTSVPSEPPVVNDVVVGNGTQVLAPVGLPSDVTSVGGHDYAQNVHLQEATIPPSVKSLGNGAFSNCVNLRTVVIPESVKSIGANCFFNCATLNHISYGGTKEQWSNVKRGSNWLYKAGTTIVVCKDGPISVNPYH